MRVLFHILTRLLLAAAVFIVLLQHPEETPPSSSTSPKLLVIPTNNLDLRLVRLFLETQGTWTERNYDQFRQLMTLRGETNILTQFNLETASPVALDEAVESALQGSDWEAARRTLEVVLERQPGDSLANLRLGLLSLPDEAAMSYLERVTESPYQRTAAEVLGVIQVEGYAPRDVALRLMEVEEWALADYFLTQQVELDNLDALSYAYRGFARDQGGGDGLNDIETALALDRGLALAYYALGLHHRARADYDLSLQALNDAVLLEPENPAFAAEVAEAYRLNQNFDQAEQWFSRAVELAPDDVRFAGLQAAFYAESALVDRGLEQVEATAQAYPEDALIQASWGRVLFLAGDLEEAKEPLEKARELAPNDPRIRLYYAEYLERQNDREGALALYLPLANSDNPYQEAAQRGILRLSQAP